MNSQSVRHFVGPTALACGVRGPRYVWSGHGGLLARHLSSRRRVCRRAPARLISVAGTFPGSFLEMSTQAGKRALPNLSTIKGVLFDVDGTLTNSDPLHFKAFHDILLQYKYQGYNNGAPISREFFDEYISGGHNILLSKFLWPDWSQERRDAFSDEKEALFRRYADSVLEPVPGLEDFLQWVKRRGLRKVAVTNAPKENARVMLDALGLGNYFDAIILGEDCARPKPHPDPYQAGLGFMGLKPSECIVCEDSPSGTTAGVAAGIAVVGILTSQTPDRMRRAGCSALVRDYHELLALAEAQCAGGAKAGNGAKV